MIEPLEPRRLFASSISGTVFNDANASGTANTGEKGLEHQIVFLDLDFDGVLENGEPNALTATNGSFSFTNLTAGVYRLRVAVPTGFRQTSPAQAFYDLAANGINDTFTAKNFGLTTTGIIRGNVFNDTNPDGIKDVTEPGLSGIIVFIDKNKNGHLDKGELNTKTDSNGNYRFSALPAGTYVVRIGVPKGLRITFPATGVDHVTVHSGQSRSNRNFGLV